MSLRVISAVMKCAVEPNKLNKLYRDWVSAKQRLEMSRSMDTDKAHRENFKKIYLSLSRELYAELQAQGHTSKEQIEKALTELKEKRPKLTVINGGKE